MNRGFVIIAQNTPFTNYIKCAEVLCHSIKNTMPNESVTLLTDEKINLPIFDNIVTFPYGDTCKNDYWKLANDWQVYAASPYDHTIKLEADLYIPRSINYWWDILKLKDLVVCTTMRNLRGEISTNRHYRKIFDDNKLPNAFNAITYFKKSEFSEHFFMLVKHIFDNWNQYKLVLGILGYEQPTTDVVYGLAMQILGEDNCTLPTFNEMSIVHMKRHINNDMTNDWTKEHIYEISNLNLRIDTHVQLYPFHYHIKNFANIIEGNLNEQ
jgi:hypothetical protein